MTTTTSVDEYGYDADEQDELIRRINDVDGAAVQRAPPPPPPRGAAADGAAAAPTGRARAAGRAGADAAVGDRPARRSPERPASARLPSAPRSDA